jgi:hypothetical protein
VALVLDPLPQAELVLGGSQQTGLVFGMRAALIR